MNGAIAQSVLKVLAKSALSAEASTDGFPPWDNKTIPIFAQLGRAVLESADFAEAALVMVLAYNPTMTEAQLKKAALPVFDTAGADADPHGKEKNDFLNEAVKRMVSHPNKDDYIKLANRYAPSNVKKVGQMFSS
jgi:hypothetical protein